MSRPKVLKRKHLQKAVNHNRKLIRRLRQCGYDTGTIPGDRALLILHHLYARAKAENIEIKGR